MRAVALLVALVAAVSAQQTILQIAESLPQFSTLVTAASQAGIASLLSAAGDKTVFAPTNDAFSKLGNNTAAWILNAHNQQSLLATLYYHITYGAVTTSLAGSTPVQLETLDLDGGVSQVHNTNTISFFSVNNAQITQADVTASNGVIQVINGVLVPGNIGLPASDIATTAAATPLLSTLLKAVIAAGLAPALSQPHGPYVVFAPTNAAFEAVPATVLSCLLSNPAALQTVLLSHVASGYVYAEQVANGASVPSLSGKLLTFTVQGSAISVALGPSSANVVVPNVDTSNGVVHVIDHVLFDNTGPCAQ